MPHLPAFLLAQALLVGPPPAPSGPGDASPAAPATPREAVAALYDVISGPAGPRDWDRFRSLYHERAELFVALPMAAPGNPGIAHLTIDDYVRRNTPHFARNAFYETSPFTEFEVLGNLAHAWSTYELRTDPDGEPAVRGINSITLARDINAPEDGWRVVSLAFRHHSPGVEIPEGYRSGDEGEPEDANAVEAIRSLLARFYGLLSGPVGATRDWDAFKAMLHPEADMTVVQSLRARGRGVYRMPPDLYIEHSNPMMRRGGFFQSPIRTEIEVFGNLAHAWSTYRIATDAGDGTPGEPVARGVNSFQLVQDAADPDAGWTILAVTWTMDTDDAGASDPESAGGSAGPEDDR